MHPLLSGWTYQLQTLQMLWLAQKRVVAMVYHRLKSSYTCVCVLQRDVARRHTTTNYRPHVCSVARERGTATISTTLSIQETDGYSSQETQTVW